MAKYDRFFDKIIENYDKRQKSYNIEYILIFDIYRLPITRNIDFHTALEFYSAMLLSKLLENKNKGCVSYG